MLFCPVKTGAARLVYLDKVAARELNLRFVFPDSAALFIDRAAFIKNVGAARPHTPAVRVGQTIIHFGELFLCLRLAGSGTIIQIIPAQQIQRNPSLERSAKTGIATHQ